MAIHELPRGEWRRYCDRLSKGLAGTRAELDVVSLDLGDRVEARWLPLRGLVYDGRADTLEIALEGVDHSIREPRELHVEETERGVVGLEVVTASAAVETLRFREPLPLSLAGPTNVDSVSQEVAS